MALEKLTTSNIVTLIGGVGAGVLITILGIVVTQWMKADVRYEEVPFYRIGAESVVLLRIQNLGWNDAKDVDIATSFPTRIVSGPRSSDDTTPCNATEGAIGGNAITGRIKRLVPDHPITLTYVIEYPKDRATEVSPHYVSSITFDGGKGKTGKPTPLPTYVFLFVCMILSIALVVAARRLSQVMDRTKETVDSVVNTSTATVDKVMVQVKEINERFHDYRQGMAALIRECEDYRDENDNLKRQLAAKSEPTPTTAPAPTNESPDSQPPPATVPAPDAPPTNPALPTQAKRPRRGRSA
jgi:hypothetical protein